MGKTRNTGFSNNAIQYNSGSITFVSGSTTLLNISSSGAIVTTGTITANTLIVQTVTSSVSFITGSTKFGTLSSNTHIFTGSMYVTGNLYVPATAGGVGIGTTNISAEGNIFLGAKSTDEGGQLIFQKGTNYTSASHLDNYQNRFRIMRGNDTGSTAELMCILMDSGNVGIGTSTPVGNLMIASSVTTTATTSQQAYDYSRFRINTYNGSSVGISIGNVNGNGTYIQTCYNEGTTAPIFINPFGNILYVGGTSIANSGITMNVLGSTVGSGLPLSRFYLNAASTLNQPCIRIDKYDNNNTTSQVFIDFTVNQQAAGNGSITANGASQATFTTWSDARLKDNITDLPSQLANIMALRPVEFDYKNGSGHQIGFIAQEVQEVYPDIVSENSEGYLTVSGLSKMESRLIKAIQELKAENDSLKTRIETLENK